MKKMFLILIVTICLFLTENIYSQVQPFLPEIFIQLPSVRDFTINSEGDEAYFSAQSNLGEISVISFIKKEKDKWSKPEIASFSGKYNDLEPFLSPDGLHLYFASNRPIKEGDEPADYNIWYVERKPNGMWSNAINIGEIINTSNDEFYPSVAKNGNIYFTSEKKDSKGKDDIYFSKWEVDHYTNPVSLSDSINSDGYDFNAFISPDESFLIFTGYRRKDGFGSGDLYISYNKNGYWTKAKNLGKEINSNQMDYCPFVDMRTNTMFFTSRRSHFDNKSFNKYDELLKEINKYKNGASRIYKVSLEGYLDLR